MKDEPLDRKIKNLLAFLDIPGDLLMEKVMIERLETLDSQEPVPSINARNLNNRDCIRLIRAINGSLSKSHRRLNKILQ